MLYSSRLRDWAISKRVSQKQSIKLNAMCQMALACICSNCLHTYIQKRSLSVIVHRLIAMCNHERRQSHLWSMGPLEGENTC